MTDKLTLLNPCPFCGSDKLRIVKLPYIDPEYIEFKIIPSHIDCLNCGADGPKIAYVDDVIESWNNRK